MFKPIQLCLLCMVCAIMVACVAKQPEAEGTVQYLDSAAVTKKIKAKLVDKLGEPGASINVKTYRDEVQLSGQVNNILLQQRAGNIAASIENVKHVRNDIMVK